MLIILETCESAETLLQQERQLLYRCQLLDRAVQPFLPNRVLGFETRDTQLLLRL